MLMMSKMHQMMVPRRASGGLSDPDAAALIARMAVQPDATQQARIQAIITSLKAAGDWSRLDLFYVLAAHDSQAALLNWKGDFGNLVAAGSPSPAFTVYRGYAGDGVNGRLESGYAPATAGGNYGQDDASMFIWSLTDVSSTSDDDCGFSSSSRINPRDGAGNYRISANSSQISGASPTSVGFRGFSRTTSSSASVYLDGTVESFTSVSTVLATTGFCVLSQASGANASSRQIAAAGLGGSMNLLDVRAALLTYLQAVGAA